MLFLCKNIKHIYIPAAITFNMTKLYTQYRHKGRSLIGNIILTVKIFRYLNSCSIVLIIV
nr:MAG TPA: hypothetical protein [Caudoviricetes sp.]